MFYSNDATWAMADSRSGWSQQGWSAADWGVAPRVRYRFQQPQRRRVWASLTEGNRPIIAAAALTLAGLSLLVPDQTRLLLVSLGLIGTGGGGLLWNAAATLRTLRRPAAQ